MEKSGALVENGNRVILADDEVLIRSNLQEMLESAGYEVAGSYGDGFAAIEGCRRLKPDIVLLDIKMPALDGLAASRYILENDLAPVVLLITAYSDMALVEQARGYGVAGYLVKPVSESMLIPTLRIAAARGQELAQLRREVVQAKQELETRKLIEKAKGIIMRREGLSEQAAYDYIRDASRKNRMSMRAVAEAVTHSL